MAKRIVCFGDSNTWGYNPKTGTRYDEDTRWTALLQAKLGDGYRVIEEGQNSRTIAFEDPHEWGDKKGLDYVLPMVESQKPLDLLIIMLGTNDLKERFHVTPYNIAGSLKTMLMQVKAFSEYKLKDDKMKILVIAPPAIREGISQTKFGNSFPEESAARSRELAKWYALAAVEFGTDFLDASFITASEEDHLHMTPEGHGQLAEAVFAKVKEIIG